MAYKVIITGSTGMVGKGVLLECLKSEAIDRVVVINRESINLGHPKLSEIIHKDFFDLDPVKIKLIGFDACFFCLGTSSIGMKEKEYSKITYDLTKIFVDAFFEQNPYSTFIYVSGTGSDSTEKGRVMWARVKGRTENMIFNKGFKDAYAFRPGIILPAKGVRSKTNWINAIYSVLKPFTSLIARSKNITTTERVGSAMIKLLSSPDELKYIENTDINIISGS